MQQIAVIDQKECVGCNRCVPACPVDAISGSVSFNHWIIGDECIGCRLCLDPCPVDCISIIYSNIEQSKEDRLMRAQKAKNRHIQKIHRVAKKQSRLLADLSGEDDSKINIKEYLANLT